VPQEPLLHAPSRHWVGAVQAPPEGVPHWPSLAQTPEAQAPGLVQAAASGRRASQAPPLVQYWAAAHWASALQPLLQLPETQAPPRQVVPPRQDVPSGAPQKPSLAQTPELHWVPEVQGWVGGAPLGADGWQAWLTPSQKKPEAHWALLAQVAAQLPPTSSQMPLLHWPGALQGCPVGTPQVPATQKAEAHWAAALQLARFALRGVQVSEAQ
jgi:hypothetical protein